MGTDRERDGEFLTFGVVGSGAISGIYLTNMIRRFPNLRVKCVASAHLAHAQKKAAEFGIAACTVEELLSDPEIDLVVNLTPVEAHEEIIRRALEAEYPGGYPQARYSPYNGVYQQYMFAYYRGKSF